VRLVAANQLDGLRVVLVRPRNPLNIGAVARAMSNFGSSHLRVVNPYDAGFREARSAVGAGEVLARAEVHGSVAEAVADCTLVVGTTSVGQRDLQQPLKRLEVGAVLIRKQLGASRVALLFGSEKIGLKNEDFSHCHWLMRIPTRGEHRSLNLGQAVAICLYELVREAPGNAEKHPLRTNARGATSRSGREPEPATAGELERLASVLIETLEVSGYLKRQSALKEEKIRRLLRRLDLSAEDGETLLGMLRQMLWKMAPVASQGTGTR
jgi:TrmH family RNA methyltransferase